MFQESFSRILYLESVAHGLRAKGHAVDGERVIEVPIDAERSEDYSFDINRRWIWVSKAQTLEYA